MKRATETTGGGARAYCRLASVCMIALIPVSAAGAQQVDLPGWGAARWGMTEAELRAGFGKKITRLGAPLRFGGAYANLVQRGVKVGGERFAAYFQMNARTHRLQQVLLDRDRRVITGNAYQRVLRALDRQYGPGTLCIHRVGRGAGSVIEMVWRFPATTVHATFMDFRTGAVLYEDPNTDRDILEPHHKRRRIVRRFLPRRITVRLHPSGRTDLSPGGKCRKRRGSDK